MESYNSLKVLLADDHTLFRQALANLVAGLKDIGQVTEAANGQEVLDILKSRQPIDILLLDVQMPVMDGIEICRYVAEHYPKVKIIMLSMLVTPATCNHLLMLGAHACLSKEVSIEELERAVKSVTGGYRQIPEQAPDQPARPFGLTSRELDVLRLMAKGSSTKDISRELDISTEAIDSRRKNICKKLGAQNAAEAVYIAAKYLII